MDGDCNFCDHSVQYIIANNNYYSKSSAALQICKDLKGLWKIFYFLLIVPRPIRDIFYGILSNNQRNKERALNFIALFLYPSKDFFIFLHIV